MKVAAFEKDHHSYTGTIVDGVALDIEDECIRHKKAHADFPFGMVLADLRGF
jgi:hypothetical protein